MNNIVTAAKRMERTRIVGLLQDYTDAALGNGELEIASRLSIIVGNLAMAEDDDEVIVTDGPPAAGGGELPPVQFNSDEADAARLLNANPRMSTGGGGFFPSD